MTSIGFHETIQVDGKRSAQGSTVSFIDTALPQALAFGPNSSGIFSTTTRLGHP